MYQYTTPTIILSINGIEFEHVSLFRITIHGKRNQLLKLVSGDSDNVDAEQNTVSIVLTQEEMASLGKGYGAIQVRIVTTENDVFATNKEKILVDSVFDEVVVE